MGIAPPPPPSQHSFLLSPHTNHSHHSHHQQKAANSMSQGFHQGIFGFSDAFDRSDRQQQENQLRRERMRVPGYTDASPASLVAMEGGEEATAAAAAAMYEPPGATNMLSDMLSFANQGAPSATELLVSQMPGGYRLHRPPAAGVDWYGVGHRQATEMFLMSLNPPPPPQQQQQQQRASSPPPANQDFQTPAPPQQHFMMNEGEVMESQGLSLSLSSTLQQFEMTNKAQEELRVREEMLYYGSNPTTTSTSGHQQQLQQAMLQQQQGQLQGQQVHVGYGGPMAVVNVLRHSKYSRAAQELLEEFCSVGRGHVKAGRGAAGRAASASNPNPSASHAGGASSSAAASKDVSPHPPPSILSPADKFEHQRRKTKLLSMLDEVDRRYNHYCDQMQVVVNSFDSVMGYGAATPYTSLAQKAMSRHFRCLKDAIASQLRQTCELLGDKDGAGGIGITKGETPRLRLLDQSLRQQRAFHQMGMMEQEAWRPQRGLPERSVNILRAWLFEHFLHPYPNDADKHLLARQTGLSRNQVTNWFINARVRLWKPMVEEMYQQESKEEEGRDHWEGSGHTSQTPIPQFQRTETKAEDKDASYAPSSSTTPRNQQQNQHAQQQRFPTANLPAEQAGGGGGFSVLAGTDTRIGSVDEAVVADYASGLVPPVTQIMFGTSGDVSLTLGLRHAGNLPDNSQFSLRDFNG